MTLPRNFLTPVPRVPFFLALIAVTLWLVWLGLRIPAGKGATKVTYIATWRGHEVSFVEWEWDNPWFHAEDCGELLTANEWLQRNRCKEAIARVDADRVATNDWFKAVVTHGAHGSWEESFLSALRAYVATLPKPPGRLQITSNSRATNTTPAWTTLPPSQVIPLVVLGTNVVTNTYGAHWLIEKMWLTTNGVGAIVLPAGQWQGPLTHVPETTVRVTNLAIGLPGGPTLMTVPLPGGAK